MTDKRSGRSVKWLCEELRKAIADEMENIEFWREMRNTVKPPEASDKFILKYIKRLEPATYFSPELKEALDLIKGEIYGDSRTADSVGDETTTENKRDKRSGKKA